MGLTAPHLEAMANARASAGSIFAVLDRKPAIDSLSTEGSRPELNGDLELNNVYFKYPARADVQVYKSKSSYFYVELESIFMVFTIFIHRLQ